jgi:hypothetical protein
MRNTISFKSLGGILDKLIRYSLCLNEIRINLAANVERSPLIHSYDYGSADDRSTLFARFSLSFVPFIQYAG